MHHGDVYRFSCHDWKLDPVSLSKLRANRILEFGTWLLKQDNSHLITRRYCWISCCVMSAIRSRNLLNASLLVCDTASWQEWFLTCQWEGSSSAWRSVLGLLNSEDEGTVILWNVSNHLLYDSVLRDRTLESLVTLLWETQILSETSYILHNVL